jgi:hypothetical protein
MVEAGDCVVVLAAVEGGTMSNLFSKNKRDAIESAMLDIFTAAGGYWEQK